MSVYNVEEYIREAVDSILYQDIGFVDNVQIVFVDDGSTDCSGKICEEYCNKYPNNITVIHKRNGGLSSARNEGLKCVEGKYINFFDPDDILGRDVLSKVYRFFEENINDIDVVAIPLYFFDAFKGEHPLNKKFKKGSRVIDLNEEFTSVLLSAASSFFKREVAVKMKFATELVTAEDAKEIAKILMDKMKYGVVSDVRYHYRKRISENKSIVQSASNKVGWYNEYLSRFSLYIIELAIRNLKYVPKFIQYTVMYDLQWKFKVDTKKIKTVLGEVFYVEYKKLLVKVLQYIDVEIIIKQQNLWPEQKCYIGSKKKNSNLRVDKNENDVYGIFLEDIMVIPVRRCRTSLLFCNLNDNKLIIEGTETFVGDVNLYNPEFYLMINGEYKQCEVMRERTKVSEYMGEVVSRDVSFKCVIENISNYTELKINFYLKYNNTYIEKNDVVVGKFFPVVKSLNNAYAVVGDYIVNFNRNTLILRKSNGFSLICKEFSLLKELYKINSPASKKAIVTRILYHIIKSFYKKEIWLLSDRINKADDNGEVFFKYLNDNKKDVSSYFILRKDSSDYKRIKNIGSVIEHLSFKHKLLHILSDKTISSAADDYVYNPFFGNEKYYRDIMYNKQHIFLQHGITKDDQSRWLNRFNKNLSIFITAANPEYESIINGAYHYGEEVIKLTGFPRFDRLNNDDDKFITIMPTWRNNLGTNDSYYNDGIKRYNDSFRESEYFRFYDALLNDSKLISAAKRLGYRIRFMPHPNVINYINWFRKNNYVVFCDISTRYDEIFATSSVVVTDYSSVAFDFAYLRKPVIYAQFDKEVFFAGEHVYTKGYFDYERDGFGEVEYDLESTVNRIIEYMKTDCKLKNEYRERIDRFFAYNDKNNCKRVYDAIKSLGK